MRISEYIAYLQDIQSKYGDVTCFECADDGFISMVDTPPFIRHPKLCECLTHEDEKYVGENVVLI